MSKTVYYVGNFALGSELEAERDDPSISEDMETLARPRLASISQYADDALAFAMRSAEKEVRADWSDEVLKENAEVRILWEPSRAAKDVHTFLERKGSVTVLEEDGSILSEDDILVSVIKHEND